MADNSQGFKRAPNRERSHTIDIDPVTKGHLKFFMEQELNYYNNMINNTTIRLRAFPEEIVALKEGYERFWSAVAYSGLNIRDLAKIDLKKWPRELRTAVPSVAIKDGKLNFNDKKFMLFDIVSMKGNIHPQMRRVLSAELLKSVIPQAEQLVQLQKNSTGQMKAPIHMLMPMAYPERRHIQLISDIVNMRYNHETRQTEISIPYTDKPLIVRDANLADEKYEIMIIRQQPHIEVNESSNWQISLMHATHRYLLDQTDQNMNVRRQRRAA